MLRLPIYIELGAVLIGALSGTLHAVRKEADAIGVLSLSMATGLGGGLIRDVLLGAGLPLALKNSWYLGAVVTSALAGFLAATWLVRASHLLERLDAMLIGLWVVMGTEKALSFNLDAVPAIFLGVVTAVGGGVIRDLLSAERPAIFFPGELYTTPALIAAIAYVGMRQGLALPSYVVEAVTIVIAAGIRLVAIHRRWQLPSIKVRGPPPPPPPAA